MDIPKVSRGGFFGIFIPGAFLLLNMSIALPISDTFIKKVEGGTIIESVELGIMSFILAFTFGIVLRVISPQYTEVFHKAKFPYFRWFFDTRARYRVQRFLKFYKAFVISEYPTENLDESNWVEFITKREAKIGKPWINYFKTYVFDRSEPLRQEILYQEGLARFVCGMCYALILSIIVLTIGWIGVRNNWPIVKSQEPLTPFLLFAYFVILLVFWYCVPKIRGREVCTTLEAFSLLYKEEQEG